jgi:hypothetical protein
MRGARRREFQGNYERLFDAARVSVRAWEKANTNRPLNQIWERTLTRLIWINDTPAVTVFFAAQVEK